MEDMGTILHFCRQLHHGLLLQAYSSPYQEGQDPVCYHTHGQEDQETMELL